jgi:cytochrome P450
MSVRTCHTLHLALCGLTPRQGWGACIGRVAALRAMRAVLAALVRRFDMRFAPGFDVDEWERESSVLVARELWVILDQRDA